MADLYRGDTGVHAPRQNLIMRELCDSFVVIAACNINLVTSKTFENGITLVSTSHLSDIVWTCPFIVAGDSCIRL